MELYCALNCIPSRGVRLTASQLGLDLKLNFIDTSKGEQFDPEFADLNPDKKIPFLVDGDFKLGESRAIMIYLVEKYGRSTEFLPQDPEGRALVNRALHFDIGGLVKALRQYYYEVVLKPDEEDPEDTPQRYERLKEVVGILDGMLENQDYVAGRNLTIADLSIIASIIAIQGFGFEFDDYKNVLAWIDRVSAEVPGYEDINDIEIMKEYKKMALGEDDEEEEDKVEHDEAQPEEPTDEPEQDQPAEQTEDQPEQEQTEENVEEKQEEKTEEDKQEKQEEN